jgi:hypothetical protein
MLLDLTPLANEQGLPLGDWPAWRRYREVRGKTSHTSNEAVVRDTVKAIPAFLAEAEHLPDREVWAFGSRVHGTAKP